MDRILIRDLNVRCIIGVNAEERREKQDVLIHLSLYGDLHKAGTTDFFEDAIDYRALKKQVFAMVEKSQYFLIEALAEAIAKICLKNSKIVQVRVTVEKPSALRFARSVGVEITRSRPG